MVVEYREGINSDITGTIIDIETIGDFNRLYRNDSRRYEKIVQVIFGFIDQEHLHIYCAEDENDILLLKTMTKDIVDNLKRPFFAFNSEFETGVLFHHIGIEVFFDGELNSGKYEKKRDVVRNLGILNYNDPFYDDGFMCISAWHDRKLEQAIAHNRACLLKEKDILQKRGYREPNKLMLVNIDA